jgi:hypothetical protein
MLRVLNPVPDVGLLTVVCDFESGRTPYGKRALIFESPRRTVFIYLFILNPNLYPQRARTDKRSLLIVN